MSASFPYRPTIYTLALSAVLALLAPLFFIGSQVSGNLSEEPTTILFIKNEEDANALKKRLDEQSQILKSSVVAPTTASDELFKLTDGRLDIPAETLPWRLYIQPKQGIFPSQLESIISTAMLDPRIDAAVTANESFRGNWSALFFWFALAAALFAIVGLWRLARRGIDHAVAREWKHVLIFFGTDSRALERDVAFAALVRGAAVALLATALAAIAIITFQAQNLQPANIIQTWGAVLFPIVVVPLIFTTSTVRAVRAL